MRTTKVNPLVGFDAVELLAAGFVAEDNHFIHKFEELLTHISQGSAGSVCGGKIVGQRRDFELKFERKLEVLHDE